MDTPAGIFACCAVVVIGLAGPRVCAADDRAPLARITIVVSNFADVPPEILDRAQVEATRTYQRMGVTMVWLGSALSDSGRVRDSVAPTPDSGFAIRLIIQPQLAAGARGSKTAMAAALETQSDREGSIYVFYDRVTDIATLHRADTALLMGIVIAHEVGHLLLHHAAHASDGLMRGVWNADDISRGTTGFLWFSEPETQEIRKTLSTCCPASAVAIK